MNESSELRYVRSEDGVKCVGRSYLVFIIAWFLC